jgi:hypothetical protein
MFDMKPELREGEAVLGEYPATVYQVKNGINSRGSNIRLFLTNQRLILKAGLGPQRPLPIHAIRDVREEKVGLYTMARLEFADGHLEWFTVQDQAQFLQALQSARAGAPVIPDDLPQASFDPGAKTTRNRAVTIVLIIAGCIIACICLLVVLLGVFYFIL